MDGEVRVCECHGVPVRAGHRGCRIKAAEAKRRYNKSAKGRAARDRYFATEKGRAAKDRYERKRIRVQTAGVSFTYVVDPERRDELAERLAGFRAEQTAERRSVKW